ncbi:fucose isomerase, partial [Bacteroides fragilis]|nr:fucose isomerase [Bacteroides fragilis]
IATWIRSKGMKVHIIHGTIPNMVKQLIDHHKAFAAQREVRGKRIGVVGYYSPWLVASNVDYLLAKRRWGIEFI